MEAVVETDKGDEEAGEDVTENESDDKAEEELDRAAFNGVMGSMLSGLWTLDGNRLFL